MNEDVTRAPIALYLDRIDLIQFAYGAAVTVINTGVLLLICSHVRLRTPQHLLHGNLWFANIILGVTVMIANVVQQVHARMFCIQSML